MTESQYSFYERGWHDGYYKGDRCNNDSMNDVNRQAYAIGYETGLEDFAMDKELQNENA